MRASVGLRKVDGRWQVTHAHASVPFYMDGSDRAAVDLRPQRFAGDDGVRRHGRVLDQPAFRRSIPAVVSSKRGQADGDIGRRADT